jgi:16S rRNA G1207 methylase RsmC
LKDISVSKNESLAAYKSLQHILSNIHVARGVFNPNTETLLLAITASQYPGNFLDLGAGAGLITIYLQQCEKFGDASEACKLAYQCCKHNLTKFKTKINPIRSNLYEKINNQYRIIVFNPPKSSIENQFTRLIKNTIQRIVKKQEESMLTLWLRKIDKKSRQNKLIKIINQS